MGMMLDPVLGMGVSVLSGIASNWLYPACVAGERGSSNDPLRQQDQNSVCPAYPTA